MGGLVMAFQNYKPWLGITGSEFVGLDNFRQMKYARMLLEQKAKEIEIEADGILSSESLRRLQNTIKGDYDVWQYVTDATDVKSKTDKTNSAKPYLFIKVERDYLYKIKSLASGMEYGGTMLLTSDDKSLFSTTDVEKELLEKNFRTSGPCSCIFKRNIPGKISAH